MDFFVCVHPQHTLSHWKAVIINGHKVYTMRSKQSSNVRCRIATALPPLYFCVFSVRQAIGEVLSLETSGRQVSDMERVQHADTPIPGMGRTHLGVRVRSRSSPRSRSSSTEHQLALGRERHRGCQRGRGQAREAGEKSGGQGQEFNRDDLEKREWSSLSSCWEVKGNKTRSAPGLAIQGTSLTFLRTASWGREQMRGQREVRKQIYSAESSLNTHHLEEATRKTSWSKGGSHARKGSVFAMA